MEAMSRDLGDHTSRHEGRDALIEMVEQQIEVLKNKLAGPHSLKELQSEVTTLGSLVETLNLRAEFIARVLDSNMSARQRDSMQASARAMNVGAQTFRREMLAAANELIRRAAALIAEAQERINKGAHQATGYALRACGLCKGVSDGTGDACRACNGSGSVLMRETAVKCPRCAGNGITRGTDKAVRYSNLCVECNGAGWR